MSQSNANEALPQGWAQSTVGEIATVVRGVSYKKPDVSFDASPDTVPILRATNIHEELDFDQLVHVPPKYVKPEQYLLAGDIVIAASSGSRSVVGKAAQLRASWTGSFGTFCLTLRPHESLTNGYLAWFLQTQQYRNRVSELSAGVNINNLRREHIEETPVSIPPLPEQRRIVAEIEKQFTRLDASVAALRRAQANLKRYRASVLRAACSGELAPTEAELARAEGREYEPADVLLERILVERRARWEAQEKRRGKYKEPAAPDTSDLPTLPDGWVWATLGQIGDLKGGVTKGQRQKEGQTYREVPYLRVANVQRGYLDLATVKTISVPETTVEQLKLVEGDVLFNEGGDRDKLGRGWVWNGEIAECIHQNHVFRARLLTSHVLPEFVSWWGNSFGKEYFERTGKQTTNLASINLSVLTAFPLPLPPLAEQRRIVAEVERRLSVVQQAEAAVEASLQRAERLRQSILKRAFAGGLVPQDPDDEPASVLLERIRAQREAEQAAASAAKKRPPRRRRTKASQQPTPEEAPA